MVLSIVKKEMTIIILRTKNNMFFFIPYLLVRVYNSVMVVTRCQLNNNDLLSISADFVQSNIDTRNYCNNTLTYCTQLPKTDSIHTNNMSIIVVVYYML